MTVGIVGAGSISDEYLRNLASYPDVDVVAIADIELDRARTQAGRFGVPSAVSTAELMSIDEIELVVNLTIPAVHAEVAHAAIAAGKHVWGEKPLTLDRESARSLLEAAATAGVVVGNAPDTILGEGIQNAQRLLDSGRVGTPHTVLTLMQGPGPDSWHPRPQFLFAAGAGPLFDIGPYYFSTLVQLLGSIDSVEAITQRPRDERVVGSGPDAGTRFPVDVPTHVSVLTRFASGAVGTSVYSFDSSVRRQSFEISGSDGTLEVPVSGFDGVTRVLRGDSRESSWETVAPRDPPRLRGVGVVEMARAIRAKKEPLAGGRLAFHVLDAMTAVLESAELRRPVALASSVDEIGRLDSSWDPTVRTL